MLVNVFSLDDDLSGIRPPNDQCHDVSEGPFCQYTEARKANTQPSRCNPPRPQQSPSTGEESNAWQRQRVC